jgi:hypothetical protein
MTVRTIAELQNALDDNLSWRRIELAAMTTEIEGTERAASGTPLARALARSGIALLYAHWEGYTKDACQHYVDFVTKRRLKYGGLSDGFVLTALRKILRRALKGDPGAEADDLLEAVRRPGMARARIPRKTAVNTKSNLRPEVLVEILYLVGLSSQETSTKKNLIDRSLCEARNEIAHGRDHYPTAESFTLLRTEVLDMLEWLRDGLLENARTQAYRHLTAHGVHAEKNRGF